MHDLYAFAKKRLKRIQQPANMHFKPNGSKQLARQFAKSIRQVIGKS